MVTQQKFPLSPVVLQEDDHSLILNYCSKYLLKIQSASQEIHIQVCGHIKKYRTRAFPI